MAEDEPTPTRPSRKGKQVLVAVMICTLVAAAVVPLAWQNRHPSLPIPAPVAPVQEPPNLVALGDSYTSGPGVLPYEPGTVESRCFRSEKAYPELAAETLDIGATSVACSGATTTAIEGSYLGQKPQIEALAGAEMVVMSFGGNDVRGLQTLGANPTGAMTPEFVANFETVELPALSRTLDISYAAIKQRLDSGAHVFVMGYPNLFPPTRAEFQYCDGIQLPLGPAAFALPLENLHLLNARLNDTIRSAAERAGFRFVDVAPAFATHDICSEYRLIWGTVDPPVPEGAMHPSGDGHRVMSEALVTAIRDSEVTGLPAS